MRLNEVIRRRFSLWLGLLVTPLFLCAAWVGSQWGAYGMILTAILFPYAAVEMITEGFLRSPDSLGAPTFLGVLLACIQYPAYGWLLEPNATITIRRRKIVAVLFCHGVITTIVLVNYFLRRL
jgi:CDP-diglyceride synthetase